MRRPFRTLALTTTMVAVALPAALPAQAAPQGCDTRTNNTVQKMLACVTADGVLDHLEAFQKIADNSTDPIYPNSRAAGTAGYAASVEYVSGLLQDAGYNVTLDPFDFTFTYPVAVEQLTPTPATYPSGSFAGGGSGDVTGGIIPVDISLTPPQLSTSGCEPADFAGLDFSGPSDIALIQRGTCTFALKAENAAAAGAEAVIIFNQGNSPAREGLIIGTLAPSQLNIPVVGGSFADGVALAAAGSTARINVRPAETRSDVSVIAELPGRNPNNVVMSGSHLDSVQPGPGINDNGSGSAAILETALKISKLKPQNTLRFAWWGGEELGLIGSTDYVEGLSAEDRAKIAVYMNYDMIASPNYVQGIYDANESSVPAPVVVPEGSEAIEALYEGFYSRAGEPYDDSEFSGRSDYQAFIEAGIPSGGLFTGAEGVKTAEQAAIWGGTAGAQFDPCYHLACDTIDNLSVEALDVNSDLVAFAAISFAYSTESVNGVVGRTAPGGPFVLPTPNGPEGTFGGGGGGLGVHDDHDALTD